MKYGGRLANILHCQLRNNAKNLSADKYKD